jgi:hypothetical protein
MALELIGAGFGRTGTLSLKLALEQLGFVKCYHMLEVFQQPGHIDAWRRVARGEAIDWVGLFEGYRASCDFPSSLYWREQLAAFPDAKIILTERDPGRWYESVMNTIWPSSSARRNDADAIARDGAQMAFEVVWDPVFDRRMDDREHVIERYLAHNQFVKDNAPADRLLVFDPAEGWEPLCTFAGCAVPATPYPRVNTTEDFRAMVGAPRTTGD